MEFLVYLFILILIVILIAVGDANPVDLYDGMNRLEEPEMVERKQAKNHVKFNEERRERFTFDEGGHFDAVGSVSTTVKRPPKSILKPG